MFMLELEKLMLLTIYNFIKVKKKYYVVIIYTYDFVNPIDEIIDTQN